jgi:hypothetical protein
MATKDPNSLSNSHLVKTSNLSWVFDVDFERKVHSFFFFERVGAFFITSLPSGIEGKCYLHCIGAW